MTINLPNDLENSVRAEVLSGHFTSEDEMVAAAVRDYLDCKPPSASTPQTPAEDDKPIWEIIEEENRSIPPEVWDALPTDLAEQHDHYIYGTPKRPTA